MKILAKIYHWILSVLAAAGMIGYIAAVVVQVFSRTFLPTVPSWTEEAARYLFIYSVAFGAGVVALKDEYARVDILSSHFAPGFKKVYELAVCVLLLVFDVYLAVYSIPKFVFLRFRMVSTAMEIPMQMINFSVLLFVILQAVAFLLKICFILTGVEVSAVLGGARDELEKIEEELGITDSSVAPEGKEAIQ
ncbi:MAG: TRAP transporter small permease subunit [Fretibacterium sp.]|nr:TRAP transporter small permease subunit [Fretibacterium sp.]